MNTLQIVFENQQGFVILNLTFLNFWLAPTIWVKEQRRGYTRYYEQAAHPAPPVGLSADWEEKFIAVVSTSSFWDSANFSAICLGLLMEAWRQLMSSLSDCLGPLKVVLSFSNYAGVGQLGWELIRGQVLGLFHVSSTGLRLSLMWGDQLGWLAVWYCFCHSAWWCWGAVCCLGAL